MSQKTVAFKSILALSIVSALSADNNVIDNPELGVPEWTSSNPDVAEIRHSLDGRVFLVGTENAGTTIVSVSGDGDPSTPETYVGSMQVTFLPGEVSLVTVDARPVTQAELDAAFTPAPDLATPSTTVDVAAEVVAQVQDATPNAEA